MKWAVTGIAPIMKKAGIVGVTWRKRQYLAKRDERGPAVPNVLEQAFEATAPNQKWAADITHVRTQEGGTSQSCSKAATGSVGRNYCRSH